jgi:hypothetical protein
LLFSSQCQIGDDVDTDRSGTRNLQQTASCFFQTSQNLETVSFAFLQSRKNRRFKMPAQLITSDLAYAIIIDSLVISVKQKNGRIATCRSTKWTSCGNSWLREKLNGSEYQRLLSFSHGTATIEFSNRRCDRPGPNVPSLFWKTCPCTDSVRSSLSQ